MSVKVIGAGLGRTGTTSLKLALEQLGFAPCYYTEMLLTHPAHITLWERVLDGQPDWDTIFEGFRATMSGPANSFYRELSEYYPSAKVILTVRDPERWHASITSTINSDDFQQLLSQGPAAKLMARVRETRLHSNDKAAMIASFEEYNAEVAATIPAERLLVYRTGDGWGPLCEFLNVPVPTTPYPHANDGESFRARWLQHPGLSARQEESRNGR